MSAASHCHPISILPDDIDFMGHVNNARYLGWVQDAVLSHWRRVAPAEEAAAKLWVALKHEITYRKPAFLDDQVIATVVVATASSAEVWVPWPDMADKPKVATTMAIPSYSPTYTTLRLTPCIPKPLPFLLCRHDGRTLCLSI